MKKVRSGLPLLAVLAVTVLLSGCWNYREVDKLAVVAGAGIDRGEKERYALTAEIISVSSGRDAKMTPQLITSEGKTVFDAARNMIASSGKRLYWSHTKVIIVSREIADEGLSKILEWFIRDAETREDVPVLISMEDTAKEIFTGQSTEPVLSVALGEALENQKSLGKTQILDILQISNDLRTKGASLCIPAIRLTKDMEKKTPELEGGVIIKNGVVAGYLDGHEIKYLNFVRNKIKYGLLNVNMGGAGPDTVTLEIFKNKTKVRPIVDGGTIRMKINFETHVAVDEENGSRDYLDDASLKKMQKAAENKLENETQALIKKVQSEYGADIFGFAEVLWEDAPGEYQRLKDRWDETFTRMPVSVKSKVIIENSAVIDQSIREGGAEPCG